MGLVPFGSTKQPATYNGASGPHSKGRMPRKMSTAAIKADPGKPDTALPVDEVDGSLRGHDRNYPRKAKKPY